MLHKNLVTVPEIGQVYCQGRYNANFRHFWALLDPPIRRFKLPKRKNPEDRGGWAYRYEDVCSVMRQAAPHLWTGIEDQALYQLIKENEDA